MQLVHNYAPFIHRICKLYVDGVHDVPSCLSLSSFKVACWVCRHATVSKIKSQMASKKLWRLQKGQPWHNSKQKPSLFKTLPHDVRAPDSECKLLCCVDTHPQTLLSPYCSGSFSNCLRPLNRPPTRTLQVRHSRWENRPSSAPSIGPS